MSIYTKKLPAREYPQKGVCTIRDWTATAKGIWGAEFDKKFAHYLDLMIRYIDEHNISPREAVKKITGSPPIIMLNACADYLEQIQEHTHPLT